MDLIHRLPPFFGLTVSSLDIISNDGLFASELVTKSDPLFFVPGLGQTVGCPPCYLGVSRSACVIQLNTAGLSASPVSPTRYKTVIQFWHQLEASLYNCDRSMHSLQLWRTFWSQPTKFGYLEGWQLKSRDEWIHELYRLPLTHGLAQMSYVEWLNTCSLRCVVQSIIWYRSYFLWFR